MMRLLLGVLFALALTAPASAQSSTNLPSVTDQVRPALTFLPENRTEEGDPFALDSDLAFDAFYAGDYLRAFDLAIVLAGRGHAASMTLLGQLLAAGLTGEPDLDEAAGWLTLAAENGDPNGRYLLAMMKLDAQGTPEDPEGAAALLEANLDAEHPHSAHALGMLHVEGRGTERNLLRAAELMREAAQDGHADAQYTLGIFYKEGVGVVPDNVRAAHWMGAAARQGILDAQVEYAVALMNGTGVQPDIEAGFAWFASAAREGHPIAQNRLAHAYARGLGIAANPTMAAVWHMQARSEGLPDPWLETYVQSLPAETMDAARQRWAEMREEAQTMGRTNETAPAN